MLSCLPWQTMVLTRGMTRLRDNLANALQEMEEAFADWPYWPYAHPEDDPDYETEEPPMYEPE